MSRLIARRLFCEYTVTFCHAAGSYRQNRRRGGKDMTLPEQERERFCQVLYHSRTSLYRLAFSITRNSSDAQEAVAEAVCRAYERYPQLREKEKLPRWLLKITANEARRLCQRRGRTVSLDDLPTEPARQYRAGRRGTIPFGRRCRPCHETSGRRWCCSTMRTCPQRRSPGSWGRPRGRCGSG